MIIYIDLLILSTILVNFVFIKTIALIFKEKLSMIRVSISLILSVLLLLLYFLPYQFYFFIRYLDPDFHIRLRLKLLQSLDTILPYLSKWKNEIKKTAKKYSIYWLISIF